MKNLGRTRRHAGKPGALERAKAALAKRAGVPVQSGLHEGMRPLGPDEVMFDEAARFKPGHLKAIFRPSWLAGAVWGPRPPVTEPVIRLYATAEEAERAGLLYGISAYVDPKSKP